MTSRSVVRQRTDWIRVVEASQEKDVDDAAWAASVLDAMTAILPRSAATAMYVLEHDPTFTRVGGAMLAATPSSAVGEVAGVYRDLVALGAPAFLPFHYPARPVVTTFETERLLDPAVADALRSARRRHGIADGLGLVVHPAPGVVLVLGAFHDDAIHLTPRERRLLTQLALHLESSHRLRCRPESVKAELLLDGTVVHREDDAPTARSLEHHGALVAEARSKRRRGDAEAIELWATLVSGEVSLVPTRSRRGRYAVLANAPASRSLRCLSSQETDVVALAARGLSSKLISYTLGVAQSVVSERLASVATKIGVASRAELVRVAALLSSDPRSELPDGALTTAESDVLALLQRGLSNPEIARIRGRSVRTIANQVASLLSKTRSATRRALITRRDAP